MSSDVYIDFNEGMAGEDIGNWIGHLGVMSNYGFNLLERLQDICYKHKNVVTPKVVYLIGNACDDFAAWCQSVDNGADCDSPYVWVPGRWRTLCPTKESIQLLFENKYGSKWEIRVD
jgi:hypothetical protein